jgi:small-conductance mechanosensitive channel
LEALRTYLGSAFLSHVVIGAIMFLGAMVLGWVAKRFLSTIGRRLAAKTDSELDDIIIEIIVDRIKWIAVVAGSYLATEELIRGTETTDVIARQWLGYAQGIIFVCFVAVVTVVIIRITDSSIKYTMERHARRTASKLNEALFPLINRIFNILIAVIALIIVLHHFGQDVSSLVVSLGRSVSATGSSSRLVTWGMCRRSESAARGFWTSITIL